MHEAPTLEGDGTCREIARGGGAVDSDPFIADGTDGCIARSGPADGLIRCSLDP